MVRVTNSIHEGESMWLTNVFIEKITASPDARLSAELTDKKYNPMDSNITRYFITYPRNSQSFAEKV